MGTPADLAAAVAAGDRRALARAITLVESNRADHRAAAQEMLAAIAGAGSGPGSGAGAGAGAGAGQAVLRIGLSGTPGVGKSTFIEAFGLMLTGLGHRVAVLAVDPSSARSGGSILGDKTRMDRLARDPAAYIRPQPSQSHPGGVARRTREAATLCAAAGYDIVLIETVGVGQSETLVAAMVDLFVLLMAPAGGDELQGVKRGIMEMADLILVNKADGDLHPAAMRTCADYAGALHLLRARPQDPPGFPKALLVSALTGSGIAQSWAEMQALAGWRQAQGHQARARADQARQAFEQEVRHGLLAALTRPGPAADALARLGAAVAAGTCTPDAAAGEWLALYAGH